MNKITSKKTVKGSAVASASCATPVKKKTVKEETLFVEVMKPRAEIESRVTGLSNLNGEVVDSSRCSPQPQRRH